MSEDARPARKPGGPSVVKRRLVTIAAIVATKAAVSEVVRRHIFRNTCLPIWALASSASQAPQASTAPAPACERP
jgi:hypothetical protein